MNCMIDLMRNNTFKRAMKMLFLLLLLLPPITIYPSLACEHVMQHDTTTAGIVRLSREEQDPPYLQAPDNEEILRLFATVPDAHRARESLRQYTRRDHMAGTEEDFALAQWTKSVFVQEGFVDEAWIDAMPALVSYPSLKENERPRLYTMDDKKNKIIWEAKLTEEVLDSYTPNTRLSNRSFNGYGPSGKARGRLVYANFGLPDDFDELARRNISVHGAIVLMRYGKCFRGLKVWNAQRHGAVAALIYSDPQQDGFSIGPVYPHGPWRPASSVQRGSVQFDSLCSGDPMRVASGNNSMQACGYEYQDLIPSIPVLPISANDATPLLQLIVGVNATSTWTGTIPGLTYRFGRTSQTVMMQTFNTFEIARIPNVIAVYKSASYGTARDRPIVVGNHRDAWVFGSVDPNSGSSVLLEVARGLGQLKKELGWKPKRTIILASWSGEELGLIGSTAWGEAHAKSHLLKHAVTYLNVDIGVAGNKWQVAATASLGPLVRSVLRTVIDPQTRKPIANTWEHVIPPLGSGSDYSVFIDHLGIPSADIRFSPSAGMGSNSGVQYGTYHSVYDDFEWMERFGDPTFEYHRTQAVILGTLTLRLADARVLPLSHLEQARAVLGYIFSVKSMVTSNAAFFRLLHAGRAYLKSAIEVQKEMDGMVDTTTSRDVERRIKNLNDRIAFAERRFLHPAGLPKRPWFKHMLQAPGLYTGYAPDVLPSIVQSFKDEKNPEQANIQAHVVADRIFDVAKFLTRKSEWVVLEDDVDVVVK